MGRGPSFSNQNFDLFKRFKVCGYETSWLREGQGLGRGPGTSLQIFHLFFSSKFVIVESRFERVGVQALHTRVFIYIRSSKFVVLYTRFLYDL